MHAFRRRPEIVVLLTMLLAVVLSACGSGDSGSAAHNPPGRSPASLNAVFDHLPRFPRSDATGGITKGDQGTIVETFLVKGATPSTVMDYFADVLPRQGFEAEQRPTGEGTESLRGVWHTGKRTLVVTTAPAPTAGGDDSQQAEPTVQYSFLLSPAGVSTS